VSIRRVACVMVAVTLAGLLAWPAQARSRRDRLEEQALDEGGAPPIEDMGELNELEIDDPAEVEEQEEGPETQPEQEEAEGEVEEFFEEEEVVEEVVEEEVPPPSVPRLRRVSPTPVTPVVRPSKRMDATPTPPTPAPAPRPTPAAPTLTQARPPQAPPLPNTAPGEKTGQSVSEPPSFDFMDVPLTNVIEAIAKMTGRNFDIDPNIGATRVTVITHDEIPPEMAYQVLESILNSRGFSMVETLDGYLIKITPTGDLQEKIGVVKGLTDVPEGYDTLSTHIVSLEHADSAELAGFLKVLGSKACMIDAYAKTNTLIVTDTSDGLRRIFAFLEEVDIPGFDTEMEIFTLEYTRAEVLAQQIQEVLLDTGSSATPTTQSRTTTVRRPVPTRPPVRPTIPGRTQPMVIGSSEEVLRIVPDERLNAMIVIATEGLMERVRDLVSKLDTPTPYEANNMHVYELLNANSEDVEAALSGIIGGAPPRAGGEKGGAQSGEVQPFEKKVVITRYEQTNALLILASPQDYKLIKEIIAQLDVPQRQVLVEAIIMDVSIQNKYGLTVDAASVTANDGFVMGNTSNLSQIMSTADLATSLTDGTTPVSMAMAVLSLGQEGGLSAGIYDHIETTINGQTLKIPFIPLLMKSLETLTDFDILSQPSLTTRDNEPASIVVGQELPVPSGRSGSYYYDPTTGQRQSRGAYSSSYGRGISREDVGVKMEVTPHINEGDYVSLETTIEVSEAAVSDIGIDPNELGPTFNKSQIENNVVVKDGMTGVIGGLIKETASHNRKQTPGLGDLPLLGWLFRTRSDERKKQNVVVLITPHIIKDGSDLERVSQYRMDQFRSANVDVLFEKGVIRRVRKRSYMRGKYRPSVDRSEQLLNEQQFGRGDIKR